MAEGDMSAKPKQGNVSDARPDRSAGQGLLPRWSMDWALFLDVDGTLVEIAERPDQACATPATIGLLGRLQEACAGAIALISGRSIAYLDRMFAPLHVALAGQHGAEQRAQDGKVQHPGGSPERLAAAKKRLTALARRHPGLLVEDKGLSLALHYRTAPELGPLAIRSVTDVVAELGSRFRAQPGKMVIEIRPTGRDKGAAIATFMKEPPFCHRAPVFIGDDVSDEYGFRVVNRLGGHSIKVGSDATAAHYRLDDSSAVRRWLADYADWALAHHPAGPGDGSAST